MKKLLVFGASSSKNSINRQFASFTANQLEGVEVNLIDLNDYEMPIFSVDREGENGIPQAAQNFKNEIKEADGIIISFAEHNGSYSAAFKNLLDWTSRIGGGLWLDTPMLLLSTSPGGRGGQSVLNTATGGFPYMGGKVAGSFALPFFGKSFSATEGITDPELKAKFQEQLAAFRKAI